MRLPIPPLTQERRKELAKIVGKQTEEARVAVRSARRDAMDMIKDAEKDKQITEDERKKGEKKIQELTDKYIASVEDIAKAKEKEIMVDARRARTAHGSPRASSIARRAKARLRRTVRESPRAWR